MLQTFDYFLHSSKVSLYLLNILILVLHYFLLKSGILHLNPHCSKLLIYQLKLPTPIDVGGLSTLIFREKTLTNRFSCERPIGNANHFLS